MILANYIKLNPELKNGKVPKIDVGNIRLNLVLGILDSRTFIVKK